MMRACVYLYLYIYYYILSLISMYNIKHIDIYIIFMKYQLCVNHLNLYPILREVDVFIYMNIEIYIIIYFYLIYRIPIAIPPR